MHAWPPAAATLTLPFPCRAPAVETRPASAKLGPDEIPVNDSDRGGAGAAHGVHGFDDDEASGDPDYLAAVDNDDEPLGDMARVSREHHKQVRPGGCGPYQTT